MLARVANTLYWTGRYVERSEHLARYLRVQYFSILDTPMSQNKDFILKSILTMYGIDFEFDQPVEELKVLEEVGFNPENPASLAATIFAARENARSVRHILSTELWEVINQYYLFVKHYNVDFFKTRGLHDFTVQVAKHCSIIRSYLDHTLIHDETWVFIELGIYLERAIQVVRILDSKRHDIEVLSENGANTPLMRYQGTITLKVLEAFDMHRRVYRKPQSQRSLFEFLTSNVLFPRSVAYNLKRVHELINQLSELSPLASPLQFRVGKLSSYFRYLEYNDVKDDLPDFLKDSLTRLSDLHGLIDEEYFRK